MIPITSLFTRFFRLQKKQIALLMLLLICAFVKSATIALLDAGTLHAYLSQESLAFMPVCLLVSAFVVALSGKYKILLSRRHGYGVTAVLSAFFLMLVLPVYFSSQSLMAAAFLFMLNMGALVLLTSAFWSVATRYLKISLDSLKFIGVFCADLLGFAVAGVLTSHHMVQPDSLLPLAMSPFVCFIGLLKLLVFLNPMPSETFVKKTGSAQEIAGQKLVRTLLFYTFAYWLLKGILLYVFCYQITETQDITKLVGFVWSLFGGIGLGMILALYQTSFLYAPLLGVLALGISFITAGVGILFEYMPMLFGGFVCMSLSAYFYLPTFLDVLQKPLVKSSGTSIQTRYLTKMAPLGLLAAGSLLYMVNEPNVLGAFLIFGGMGLLILTLWLVRIYSAILMDSFVRRQWREGPLMIATPQLFAYMLEQLKSPNADEVIYFIRILGIAKHPSFQKQLLKLLHHPNAQVRLFALQKLRQYAFGTFSRTIQNMFENDKDAAVRTEALTSLLVYAAQDNQTKAVSKYMKYLSHKDVRDGLLTGLLLLGGDSALLAMDTLQKMASSKNEQENIRALKIIEKAPLSGLVRLVLPLMKQTSLAVANQALLTAGAMKHPELLPYVFMALDDFDLQESALVALKRYGKQAFPPLEKMLQSPQTPATRQKTLVLFLDALNSGEGKQILLRLVFSKNQKLRKQIIQLLLQSHIVWIQKNRKTQLTKSLYADINRLLFELDFIKTYSQSPNHETDEVLSLLRQSMQEDIADTRELILMQLQLLKSHPLCQKALRVLLSDQTENYVAALGVVQDFVPHKLYLQIKRIALLPVAQQEKEADRVILPEKLTRDLMALLDNPPFELSPWMKSAVLYCLRRLNDEMAKPTVLKVLQDTNPTVLKAAVFAYARLEQDKEVLHQTLLQIPTNRLAMLDLTYLLEG